MNKHPVKAADGMLNSRTKDGEHSEGSLITGYCGRGDVILISQSG